MTGIYVKMPQLHAAGDSHARTTANTYILNVLSCMQFSESVGTWQGNKDGKALKVDPRLREYEEEKLHSPAC